MSLSTRANFSLNTPKDSDTTLGNPLLLVYVSMFSRQIQLKALQISPFQVQNRTFCRWIIKRSTFLKSLAYKMHNLSKNIFLIEVDAAYSMIVAFVPSLSFNLLCVKRNKNFIHSGLNIQYFPACFSTIQLWFTFRSLWLYPLILKKPSLTCSHISVFLPLKELRAYSQLQIWWKILIFLYQGKRKCGYTT